MVTKNSTVRYAAKQAYQLNLMRGLSTSTIAGHYCRVFAGLGYVIVHGIENKRGEFETRNVPIAKAWCSL